MQSGNPNSSGQSNDIVFDSQNQDIWQIVEKGQADPPSNDTTNPPAQDPTKPTDITPPAPAEPAKDVWAELVSGKKEGEEDDDEGDTNNTPAADPNAPAADPSKPDPDEKPSSFKAVNKLIEKGVLEGYEDGKPIKTFKELEHLIQQRDAKTIEQTRQQTITELYASLDEKGQRIFSYFINGGENLEEEVLKPMFEISKIQSFDISTESQKEQMIIQGLMSTLGMSATEAESEMKLYKDAGHLDAKATFYKNKLESQHQAVLQNNLQKAQALKAEEARRAEIEQRTVLQNVQQVFSKDTINGIPVNPLIKKDLKNGLLSVYNSQRNPARQLSKLEAAIEHYQYVEPNYEVLAAALWMLTDFQGYHQAYFDQAAKKSHIDLKNQADNVSRKGGFKRPE